jgi:hypothetical protein
MRAKLQAVHYRLPATGRARRSSCTAAWRHRRSELAKRRLETIERLEREARQARRYSDPLTARTRVGLWR